MRINNNNNYLHFIDKFTKVIVVKNTLVKKEQEKPIMKIEFY